MTQTLQERRALAAEQVDVMLSTLSEKKVQKITELFDKTVIQEHLDDTNLTEEWEAYHDWLALRTGSAYPQLSKPGNGTHKLVPTEDTVSEDSRVSADLEEESKSANEAPEAAVAEPAETSINHAEQEREEVVAPEVVKEPQPFFASDDDDDVDFGGGVDDERQSHEEPATEPALNRITVHDVLQKEFTIEKLRGGYNENDVDDFLDDIAAFLNERHSNAELDEKIASVEGQGFHRKKLGSGCNVDEVDAYLDEIIEELKARKN